VLDLLLAGLGLAYLGAIAWLALGVRRAAAATAAAGARPDLAASLPSVSIVVAARDEEAALGPCLESLRRQEYGGPLEVVVVDDGSTDGTAEVARQQAALPGAAVWLVGAPEPPAFRCRKKSALAAGIAASTGELLLFTDADCRAPSSWVGSTVARFGPGVGLVAGYATRRGSAGLRGGLVQLDNLMVAALGAGSTGMGQLLSCTGRNLAYRRAVYDQVGGFSRIGHLVGGDDVYFARLVAAETDWLAAYHLARDAAVQSDAGPPGLSGLLNQKVRHAAKAARYGGGARLAGALAYLYHFLIALGAAQVLGWGHAPVVWAAAWGSKWVADAFLVAQLGRRVGERPRLALLPLLELVYIPYVLLFTVAGRLGLFRWKASPVPVPPARRPHPQA